MSEEIKSLKNYISTTKNEIFTTFKIETISNLIIYYEDLQQKVEQQEKEIDRLNNIIKELSKDVDMWNKKYNEKFDIINELEKWLEDNLGNCRTNQNYTSNQIYNLKEDIYYRCLDKLKALKEENK